MVKFINSITYPLVVLIFPNLIVHRLKASPFSIWQSSISLIFGGIVMMLLFINFEEQLILKKQYANEFYFPVKRKPSIQYLIWMFVGLLFTKAAHTMVVFLVLKRRSLLKVSVAKVFSVISLSMLPASLVYFTFILNNEWQFVARITGAIWQLALLSYLSKNLFDISTKMAIGIVIGSFVLLWVFSSPWWGISIS